MPRFATGAAARCHRKPQPALRRPCPSAVSAELVACCDGPPEPSPDLGCPRTTGSVIDVGIGRRSTSRSAATVSQSEPASAASCSVPPSTAAHGTPNSGQSKQLHCASGGGKMLSSPHSRLGRRAPREPQRRTVVAFGASGSAVQTPNQPKSCTAAVFLREELPSCAVTAHGDAPEAQC